MQVVVFEIGGVLFAISTDVVQSINDKMSVTKVPMAPEFIKGLINLRGSIKTLVDINLILNIEDNNEKENIMILSIEEEEIAIEVDFVKEVIEIDKDDIRVIDECDKSFMQGIIKIEGELITLLDINLLIGTVT
ncbi:chemotaxis protein CheW [Clostridium sp.]|uniref:chemotaxis protein CheW n=1 Tax=Clostridium sp. TaxID=1506 RepID=UPI002FC5EDCE